MNNEVLWPIPLFEVLSKDAQTFIVNQLQKKAFASGETIVRQGEPGDSLYIITSGLVKVMKRDHSGKSRELARFHTGDYFGEMSLLAGHPRSADITAVTDTTTLVLCKDEMDRILYEYPAIAVHFSKVLSKRLRDTSQLSLRTRHNVSVIALYSRYLEPRLQNILAINLTASFSKELMKSVILVDASGHEDDVAELLRLPFPRPDAPELADYHDVLDCPDVLACIRKHKTGIHVLSVGASSQLKQRTFEKDMSSLLLKLREHYDYVLINCASKISGLVHSALDQADLLLYLTEVSDESIQRCKKDTDMFIQGNDEQGELLISVVHDADHSHIAGPILEEALAPHTFMTIHTRQATMEHFVRTGRLFVLEYPKAELSLSLQHITRRIGQIRVGLALGSGSARGFAHVGVLKVLEKHGIPVDMIAGTSMGAFVGGFFAAGVDSLKLEQLVLDYRSRRKVRNTIFDLTLPIYGLSRGTHLSKFMRSHLHDKTFDDLAIPFAAVATDINTGREIVLRHGTLWEALRASGSVPVIFEPYYLDGRYLVDGGITNPLPTDILIENNVDFIISSSVNSVSSLSRRYRDEEISKSAPDNGVLPAHEQTAKKCGITNALVRTLGIMSATNTTNKARLADIDIRPNVSYIDWNDFHRGDELLHEGEEAAEKALPTIFEMLREHRN